MRMVVHPRSPRLGDATALAVRRRLLLAFSTFASRIATVTVRLVPADQDCPAACRLALRLRSGPELAIERFDSDLLEAVMRSAAQANRWIRRQLLATEPQLARRR